MRACNAATVSELVRNAEGFAARNEPSSFAARAESEGAGLNTLLELELVLVLEAGCERTERRAWRNAASGVAVVSVALVVLELVLEGVLVGARLPRASRASRAIAASIMLEPFPFLVRPTGPRCESRQSTLVRDTRR